MSALNRQKNNSTKPNELIHEKSPYLLQHAYNPVNWHPWGEKAFQKAADENKPVFLSIGYSTCHWCHVMAEESFQDNDIAALLNGAFISIKVDREERPDIDSIYMRAAVMLNGNGGWPLNVFLLPDKRPFFALTYIPRERSYSRPGFKELLLEIINLWYEKQNEIVQSADSISAVVLNNPSESAFAVFDPAVVALAYDDLVKSFDNIYGGFSQSPKFPSAQNLTFLMQYHYYFADEYALEMAEKTLFEMQNGGIFDHLGYGFHRYATDRKWHVPHFEKMLYDQAMLLLAYCDAYQITKKQIYRETIEKISEFCMTEMLSASGGFFSAMDADSEGMEGKFYLWDYQEIQSLLKHDTELFCEYFGVLTEGNYIDEFSGRKTGKNILHSIGNRESIAQKWQCSPAEIESKIQECRKILLPERNKRENPFLDDKILTDWNGLFIAGLAKAGFVLNRKDYIQLAEKTAQFFLNSMGANGELFHRYRDGQWAISGFLDDYVFLVYGMLFLYETTFNIDYLSKAVLLTNYTIENFYDTGQGGFFLTSHFTSELPVRKKEYYDGAYPSGNSLAVMNLLKISRLIGKKEYEDLAIDTMDSCGGLVEKNPAGFTQLLQGFSFIQEHPKEIILAGDLENGELNGFLDIFKQNYFPDVTIMIKNSGNAERLASLAPYTKDMLRINNSPSAYVCIGSRCQNPVSRPEDLLILLNS